MAPCHSILSRVISLLPSLPQVLFEKAKLSIERGEKLAFIGPNGCGKSTLLRFIMGTEEPQHGVVEMGEHNVVPNYFVQNQVHGRVGSGAGGAQRGAQLLCAEPGGCVHVDGSLAGCCAAACSQSCSQGWKSYPCPWLISHVPLSLFILTPSVALCLQAEALDLQKTVLQTVEEVAEGWKMNDIKALLGRSVGATGEA